MVTIFPKSSTIDVRLGSKYPAENSQLYAIASRCRLLCHFISIGGSDHEILKEKEWQVYPTSI